VARPPIQTIDICRHYRSGQTFVPAISNVSLIIEQGEFVAIRGRSGSGKSTLMNLLGLLERPNSGQYLLNGQEVAALSERTRAQIRNREIGFVFQLPTLLPRSSALENIVLPLIYSGVRGAERWRRGNEALDRVGLSHRRNHWPNQLSGGEQQRVAIARALVSRPAVLLADEPTGALDSNTSDEILTLLAELNRDGSTIVVVTHDPGVAERARRRITLHDGCIVEDDLYPKKQVSVLRLVAAERR
jgi:putative ABC transport system ATP-binding protein